MTFPCFLLLMIYPRDVETIKGARKQLVAGYFWAALLIFITITMTMLVLGAKITASAKFPSYLLATEINVGIIFSRLEFLISTIWIFTHYIIGFIFLYSGIMGLTEILGLKDYRKIVLPIGLIVLLYSGRAFNDVIHAGAFVTLTWPLCIGMFAIVLPALLLVVNWIRNVLAQK